MPTWGAWREALDLTAGSGPALFLIRARRGPLWRRLPDPASAACPTGVRRLRQLLAVVDRARGYRAEPQRSVTA